MHTKKKNNTNKLPFYPNKNSKITKIQKLQKLKIKNKIKKKKLFSIPIGITQNWPVRPVFFPVRNRGGQTYRIAGQYGIFRPYRPVRYGIDNLDFFKLNYKIIEHKMITTWIKNVII